MYSLLYPLVLTTLGAGAPVEEALKPPQGIQPLVTVARLTNDDKIQFHQIILVPRTEAVERTVIENGVPKTVKAMRTVFTSVTITRSIAGKDVQGYDTSGKKLDRDAVRKRLKKDTPVLISSDGKPVDPFYLKLTRPGTLVLVAPTAAYGAAGGVYGGYGSTPPPVKELPKRPRPVERK
jgi:hypothetical protein